MNEGENEDRDLQSEDNADLPEAESSTIQPLAVRMARLRAEFQRDRQKIRRQLLTVFCIICFFPIIGYSVYCVANKDIYEATCDGENWFIKIHLLLGANINTTYENGLTLLCGAVIHEQEKTVQFLLENDADPNGAPVSTSPISVICGSWDANEHVQCNIANMLLEYGADINTLDDQGLTPLARAVANEKTEIIALLLKKGADPNCAGPDDCYPDRKELSCIPLWLALDKHRYDIAKTLVDYGADVNMPVCNLGSLIFWKIATRNIDGVQFLIENGADVNLLMDQGYELTTPLDYAEDLGNQKVIEILKKAGAKTAEELKKTAAPPTDTDGSQ